jgi:hypothetical protein
MAEFPLSHRSGRLLSVRFILWCTDPWTSSFETICGINLSFLHWRRRRQISSKFWYSCTIVHGVTARRIQSLYIHCRQNLTCDNILRVSTSWSSAKIVREADLNYYTFLCFLSLQILNFSRPWLHVVNTVTDNWVSHRIARSYIFFIFNCTYFISRPRLFFFIYMSAV